MAFQCAAHEHQEAAGSAERLRYFPRQLLTADDMRTEQQYFREKLRRHNRMLHGWGVVCGLQVVAESQPAARGQHLPRLSRSARGATRSASRRRSRSTLTVPARPKAADCTQPPAWGCNRGRAKTVLVQIRYVECHSRPMRTLPAGCGCDETACEYSGCDTVSNCACIVAPEQGARKRFRL